MEINTQIVISKTAQNAQAEENRIQFNVTRNYWNTAKRVLLDDLEADESTIYLYDGANRDEDRYPLYWTGQKSGDSLSILTIKLPRQGVNLTNSLQFQEACYPILLQYILGRHQFSCVLCLPTSTDLAQYDLLSMRTHIFYHEMDHFTNSGELKGIDSKTRSDQFMFIRTALTAFYFSQAPREVTPPMKGRRELLSEYKISGTDIEIAQDVENEVVPLRIINRVNPVHNDIVINRVNPVHNDIVINRVNPVQNDNVNNQQDPAMAALAELLADPDNNLQNQDINRDRVEAFNLGVYPRGQLQTPL